MSDRRDMSIEVSTTLFALHRWPGAEGRRSYLGAFHGHNFVVTAEARVTHADRQIEFHDLRDSLGIVVSSRLKLQEGWRVPSFGDMSCEDIANAVLDGMPTVRRVTVAEDETVRATVTRVPARPQIVTVCGSTRFKDETLAANAMLTQEGHIVLGVGVFAHADGVELSASAKASLDELHLRKIEASDFIYVVNPNGYIGESTHHEIHHARKLGLPIVFLVPPSTVPVARRPGEARRFA